MIAASFVTLLVVFRFQSRNLTNSGSVFDQKILQKPFFQLADRQLLVEGGLLSQYFINLHDNAMPVGHVPLDADFDPGLLRYKCTSLGPRIVSV